MADLKGGQVIIQNGSNNSGVSTADLKSKEDKQVFRMFQTILACSEHQQKQAWLATLHVEGPCDVDSAIAVACYIESGMMV